ncbi:DUF2252 domain-containing protein [Microbacterium invictum]|uniref:DUF2252 domain-containing protein n=1 Tax=Microbacterium invictum TaxID=515415 RepID=A0ABZ0V9F2_9MICO|nr:DUF2252 domain-containing protein [Microbacterium invictum]WQB70253.1 DUF2252 domain-containing protein [Microbacterium invictum]
MPRDPWIAPPTRAAHTAEGRIERGRTPRSALAHLVPGDRDPMAVLDAQDVDRVPELVPLRTARMGASAFAFYRGSAAIMADDLSRCPSTNIFVASCGDAHLSNFGLYASPQRTLVFDLNDFDESAWAPFEWDVKRLTTSVVIAGRATSRDDAVVEDAARQAVRTYQRALRTGAKRSPLDRYFDHFDALGAHRSVDAETAAVVERAVRSALKRTGARAARKLTGTDDHGRAMIVDDPPVMTHLPPDAEARAWRVFDEYQLSTGVDIRLLLQKYAMADVAARVVGVGSVGTRCLLIALQDGDGDVLLLQGKEAGESVLIQFGRAPQPPAVQTFIEHYGNGGRVVALQRILQAVSDPFLGHIRRSTTGALRDFYVRQFHDMKGGFDPEVMDDGPFRWYAMACAAALARAHGQSPAVGTAAGYVGGGERFAEAIVAWSYAYADVSYQDWQTFRRHRAIAEEART